MTLTVVVNPTAGRGRAARLLPDVETALVSQGVTYVVRQTAGPEDIGRYVAQARDEGAERVAVMGGDGTVHAAVQPLVGSATALAIIPTGTGDDNARTFSIPLGDIAAAVQVALTGQIQDVDVGRVECVEADEYFLGVLSTGFDSLVNERANRMRWPTGKARYVAAILAELRTFRPVPYRAELDDREVGGTAMLVAVGNGPSYGGGMRVCPDAQPHDGLLDVTWLGGVPTRTFLRVFPSVFSGKHVESPY
ncbi:MAG: YegS/Rv2252/BmrU family lipid kinase, partial [Candidatus Nanopelagicales bacterium]